MPFNIRFFVSESDSDDESPDSKPKADGSNMTMACAGGALNPFVEQTPMTEATEYKKGYVMRKCCYDSNNKKSECKRNTNLVIRLSLYVYSTTQLVFVLLLFLNVFHCVCPSILTALTRFSVLV